MTTTRETVLVTGATGNVGAEIIRQLLKSDSRPTPLIRAAVFDINEAQRVLSDVINQIACIPFDFAKPETFAPAFAGVDRLFLMRPPAISDVPRYIAPAIAAAKAAGVRQIVFLSLQGVERHTFVPHYKIEQAILASGMAYTFLRCGFFMQNLNTTHRAEIRDRHEIAVPAGKSKTAFVDVRDIAAVAAHTLTTSGHENRCYTLTGEEALDYDQVATTLSDVLGFRVRYTHPSVLGFLRQQRQAGKAWGYALVVTMLYTLTRWGNAAEVSDDLTRLLHRPPISFRQYAQDYRQAWG